MVDDLGKKKGGGRKKPNAQARGQSRRVTLLAQAAIVATKKGEEEGRTASNCLTYKRGWPGRKKEKEKTSGHIPYETNSFSETEKGREKGKSACRFSSRMRICDLFRIGEEEKEKKTSHPIRPLNRMRAHLSFTFGGGKKDSSARQRKEGEGAHDQTCSVALKSPSFLVFQTARRRGEEKKGRGGKRNLKNLLHHDACCAFGIAKQRLGEERRSSRI